MSADAITYQASRLKRRRATKAEMELRAAFLCEYAERHGPVTVRQLYYQAEVHKLPGIDKTDSGYSKTQQQVLALRRAGRMSYEHIADATRWMRKPKTYDGPAEALAATAKLYRKSLWTDADCYVEFWCEKDALSGVIYPVTSRFDVPLMVTRGFSSETFCYEAIAARDRDQRPYYVYYLGDFDRAGQDAARSLENKLTAFAADDGIEIIFQSIAVTPEQVRDMNLSTRPHKRETAADKKWRYTYACELDAIEPDVLRALVERSIRQHVDPRQLAVLKVAEQSERAFLADLAMQLQPTCSEGDV
jgi:hypothetical protein